MTFCYFLACFSDILIFRRILIPIGLISLIGLFGAIIYRSLGNENEKSGLFLFIPLTYSYLCTSYMRRYLLYIMYLFSSVMLSAQELDNIRVSLLTCSPGNELYQLYGHTAVRCQNFTKGMDVVFNYGVFSFQQPHFIWRFTLGQCDYMVQPLPWKYFITDYEERGSGITAQVLNLTDVEANRLMANLMVNSMPENREYRYNFLYNNCTTKVRDMLEEAVDGDIAYRPKFPRETYRQILHRYTDGHPWAQEGNDFLLGASVDTILSDRAMMFAPEYMKEYADSAKIYASDGGLRPLVLRTETLLEERPMRASDAFPFSPLIAVQLLLAFCAVVMLVEYRVGRMFWLWDVVLLSAQGVAGTLVLFMFLFSAHPAVDSNWLVCILNPLPLFAIPVVVRAAWNRRKTCWHALNTAILTLFVAFSPWMPQDFGNIIVPLAFVLLTRPISYYLYYQKKKK